VFSSAQLFFKHSVLTFIVFFVIAFSNSAFAALGASVTLGSGSPTNIYPSETTTIEITLANSNTLSSVNNVAFNTSLPGTLADGLIVAGAATYTCNDPSGPGNIAGSGVLTAALGTQAITLTNGVIPARANNTDGTCTISIPVTAATSTGSSASYEYQIADGAVTGNDGAGVANTGSVSQSVNVTAMDRPNIAKSFSNTTAVLGGNSRTLTITLTNSNPVAIADFNITDTFPTLSGTPIIAVAPTPNASMSCNNGGSAPIFTPGPGDTVISATGTIPAQLNGTQGQCTLSVDIVAASTDGRYSTSGQTNTIDRIADFSNEIGIAAQENATATITVLSPLDLNKSFAHSSLSDGEADSLTITLINNGDSDLTISNFQDSPIDGVDTDNTTGLRVTGQSTTCAGGAVTAIANNTGIDLTGGVIPAGGSCTVSVDFIGTVAVPGEPISYTNLIPEGAVDVSNPAIVSRSRSASVLVADNLRVLKSAIPEQAAPGNPVQYTITVQNFTASPISNLTIDDTLPTGMTFLTGTIAGNDFNPELTGTGCSALTINSVLGDASANFVIGSVPARGNENSPGQCRVEFWAMADAAAADGDILQNTLDAGDVCYNAGASCNGGSASSSNTVVETDIATVTKQFNSLNAVTLSEGTIATLTFNLSNITANPLTNVSLSDTFPTDGSGQLRVATPANASSTCGAPTITAVPGSTSVAMNGATVPARADNGTGAAGSCLLTVDVIGPAGVYPNTATVSGNQTSANNVTTAFLPFDSNTATLTYLSVLDANKAFSPAAISSGGQSTVRVTLSNASALQLDNVSFTDNLPAGMLLADPVNAYTTCDGSTSFTSATAGSNTITFNGATVAGNSACDVLFDVVATGASSWTNTLAVGDITADNGIQNTAPVSANLTLLSSTDITVGKTSTPSTLTFPGQTSVLTVTITNGSTAVSNLSLTDYFTADGLSGSPANGMIIASTPLLNTDCPNGVVSGEVAGTSVSIDGVSLAAGESCSFSANVTSTTIGGVTNYIPANAVTTDQGLSNGSQATTSLTTQSNIGVVKMFTPNVIKADERSRLRVTFYNATPLSMSDIAVTDVMPAGVTIPAGPDPMTTCVGGHVSYTNNTVSISGGSLAAALGGNAASCYLEIDVTASVEGTYVNTIAAGEVTAQSGGSLVTNAEPTTDTLRIKEPLLIHVAFADQTLDAGNPATFTTGTANGTAGTPVPMTIYIENPNSETVTGLRLIDQLPSGLTIAPMPNASTTCSNGAVSASPAGTDLQLTGATLNATSSCTITVDVLSHVSGTYTNDIAGFTVATLEGVSNEEPTEAELIIATPPAVLKEFNPAVIPSGGISTLTIRLTNDNASAITLTSAFVDNLPVAPGPMLVAPIPNISTTCPGAVTAVAGASSVTYANGAVIPAGGCSIKVDVTATASGEHVNNIPAGDLQTTAGVNPTPTNSSLFVSDLGFISGRIFADNDVTPDGVYTEGVDTPISAAQISLVSGTSCSGSLVSISGVANPTTTDSSGRYLFSQLPAGTYSVCQTDQPTGTMNGATTAGTILANNGSTGTSGTASNPTTTTSQITSITLNADGAAAEISGSVGNDFAEIVPSSISGTVFVDQNNNGVKNGADTPLAGETIELLNSGNAVIATAVTDAYGNYTFDDLAPGTYSIRQPNQPANTANGLTVAGAVANGGTQGTASATTVTPSLISAIVLPPNTATEDNNFAEIPENGRISGKVFIDFNNDGGVDGVDHGIDGQTINLTGTDTNGNPIAESTVTDSEGNFSFTDLPAGTYTLTQPAQPINTSNGITTAGSGGGTTTNVSTTPSSISGIVLSSTNLVAGDNLFAEQASGVVDLTVALSHTPATLGIESNNDYYIVEPSNIGDADSDGLITIVTTIPPGITPTGTRTDGDWNCAIAGQVVTCTSNTVITAGGGLGENIYIDISVGTGLEGQVLVAESVISGGNEPSDLTGNNTDTDPTAISANASISGHVWRDANHDRVRDLGEEVLEGWEVHLKLNGRALATTHTAADGSYSFTDLSPDSGYEIEFREPSTGTNLGQPVPNESNGSFTSGVMEASNNPAGAVTTGFTLSSMTLLAGDNITEQSLPVDPSGVVYNSVTREAVAGAEVTLNGPAGFDPELHLIGGSANQTQTTSDTGLYQFLLNGSSPSGVYTLEVTAPSGFLQGESILIPACVNTPSVSAAPDPALVQNNNDAPVLGTTLHSVGACPITSAGFAAGANTTQYYFGFNLDPGLPSGNVLNNHIPLDPVLEGAIAVTKTAAKDNVSQGEFVPYTITATNRLEVTLEGIDMVDQTPAGFKYVAKSARVDSIAREPVIDGRQLTWSNIDFAPGQTHTINLLLIPGTGVSDGEYINRAWAELEGNRSSNIATATVRIVPDPTFDCSDIIGKVFDDQNSNGYQDKGEPGLAGVRVATVNGELITTDKYGRYHMTCAATPDELKGNNFILKLDTHTLPSGYRVTTENPRVVRLTRGKVTKLNFGASIHRVVRLDVDSSIWQGEQLEPSYEQGLAQLLEILSAQPSVLRIGYQRTAAETDSEAQQLAEKLAGLIEQQWQAEERNQDKAEDSSTDPEYDLSIEIEIIEPSLTVEASK